MFLSLFYYYFYKYIILQIQLLQSWLIDTVLSKLYWFDATKNCKFLYWIVKANNKKLNSKVYIIIIQKKRKSHQNIYVFVVTSQKQNKKKKIFHYAKYAKC